MSEITTGATGAWSYRAGAWFAVFGSKATVLLPDSQKDQVVALWALVDGGAGFDDVLDGLLASGLSRIPGFVLISTDDGPTRILLRGKGVEASLVGDGEDVTLDGAASHTWVERTVEGVTALRVTLPDAGAEAEGGEVLDFPILGGLVRVGRVDRPPVAVAAAAEDAADDAEAAVVTPAAIVADDDAMDEASPMDELIDVPLPGETQPDAPGPDSLAEPLDDPFDIPPAPPVDGLPVPPVVVPPPPFGGAHVAPSDDAPEADAVMADEADAPETDAPEVDAPAAEAEDADPEWPAIGTPAAAPAEADTTDELMVDEPAPFEAEPVTEMMEVVGGDPLSDPLPEPGAPIEESADAAPPAPPAAPDGWVTPWDTPAPPAPPLPPAPPVSDVPPVPDEAHPLAEPDTPAVPAPVFPPLDGATEVAPAGWAPAPPPPDQPGVVDAPPLPIGSWEPVGGAVPPPPAALGADHDGLTIAGSGEEPAVPVAGIPGQPQLPAVTPPVATLIFSDGQNVVVDRAVLIGRAPEARRFTSTEQPTLVTVPSRLHEISSTHVEVRPGTGADHGTAVVTDMGSTNGTVLVQPGLAPEDLKPGIAVQLIPGAIINLGDGITIQVNRP